MFLTTRVVYVLCGLDVKNRLHLEEQQVLCDVIGRGLVETATPELGKTIFSGNR